MSYSDKDKAKEHWNKSKDNAHEAGQHAASAASTVGHDFRAAAGEAAEAGKYAARRCVHPLYRNLNIAIYEGVRVNA